MAVGAVQSEHVSGPNSLICRESTGNSIGFEGGGERLGSGKRQISGYFGESSLGSGTGKDCPGIRELGADNRETASDPGLAQLPEDPSAVGRSRPIRLLFVSILAI